MQLDSMFFAKAAETTPDGLFWVLGGGVEAINAAGFPCGASGLALLMRLVIAQEEAGREHRLEAVMVGPGGEEAPIAPPTVVPFNPTPRPERPSYFTLVLQLTGVAFPAPGRYGFRVMIDGNPFSPAYLYVDQQ